MFSFSSLEKIGLKKKKKKKERKINYLRKVKADSFSIFKNVKVRTNLYWNIHFTKYDSRFFTRKRSDSFFFSNRFSFNSGFSSFSRFDTKVGKLSYIASFFLDLYNKFCFLNDYSIYRTKYFYNRQHIYYNNYINKYKKNTQLRSFDYYSIKHNFFFFYQYVRSFFTFHFFIHVSNIMSYRCSSVSFFYFFFFFSSCFFFIKNMDVFFFHSFFFRFFYFFFHTTFFFSLNTINFLFFFSLSLVFVFFYFFFFFFYFFYFLILYYFFFFLFSLYDFIFFFFYFIFFQFVRSFFFSFSYKYRLFSLVRSFFSKYKYKIRTSKHIFLYDDLDLDVDRDRFHGIFFLNKLLFSHNKLIFQSTKNKKPKHFSETYDEEDFLFLCSDLPYFNTEVKFKTDISDVLISSIGHLYKNKDKKTEFTIREEKRLAKKISSSKVQNIKVKKSKSKYKKNKIHKAKITYDKKQIFTIANIYSVKKFLTQFHKNRSYLFNSKKFIFRFFLRFFKYRNKNLNILYFIDLNSRFFLYTSFYFYINSVLLNPIFTKLFFYHRVTFFLKSKLNGYEYLFFSKFIYKTVYRIFLRKCKFFLRSSSSCLKLFPFFLKIKYIHYFFFSKLFFNRFSYFSNSFFFQQIQNKYFFNSHIKKNALFGRRLVSLLKSKLYNFFFYNTQFNSMIRSKRVKLKLISFFFSFFFLRKRKGSFNVFKLRRLLWKLLFRGRSYQSKYRSKNKKHNDMNHLRRFSYYVQNGFHYTKIVNMYFFLNYFDIHFFDFYNICKSLKLWNQTLYSVFSLLEMSRYTFLSNNFFGLYNRSIVFFNNVRFVMDTSYNYNPIFIGDILEFRGSVSCYSGAYILLFNLFFFCRYNFLRNLLYKTIISVFSLFLLNFKQTHTTNVDKLFYKQFIFYTGWCFRRTNNKYLFRPLHYYFSSLLYKSYMPWLSFKHSFKSMDISFVKFINNLDFTHKLYLTHFFGPLSFNLNILFFTNWYSGFSFFSNFSYFSYISTNFGFWALNYCSDLFIRSMFAIRIFNSFTYNSDASNNYLLVSSRSYGKAYNMHKKKVTFSRAISFFSRDILNIDFSSISDKDKDFMWALWKSPLGIISKSNNNISKKLSHFFNNRKLKKLPSFLYSFYIRRSFFFYFYKKNKYKLSRKFFILFSSFSLMYKRIFETLDCGINSLSIFPLFNYKLYHSNWLRPLFFGSSHSENKFLVFHKLGNSAANHHYSVGLVASYKNQFKFFIKKIKSGIKMWSSFRNYQMFKKHFINRKYRSMRLFFFLHFGTFTDNKLLSNLNTYNRRKQRYLLTKWSSIPTYITNTKKTFIKRDLGFAKFFAFKRKKRAWRNLNKKKKKINLYVKLLRFVYNSGWFINKVSHFYFKRYRIRLGSYRSLLVNKVLLRYARKYAKLQLTKYRKRTGTRVFLSSLSSSITNPRLALSASEFTDKGFYFFPYERKYKESFSDRSYVRRSKYLSKFILRRLRMYKPKHKYVRKYWKYLFLRSTRKILIFSLFDKSDPYISSLSSYLKNALIHINSLISRFSISYKLISLNGRLFLHKLRFFVMRSFLRQFIFSVSYINRYYFFSIFSFIHKYKTKYKYKFKFISFMSISNNYSFYVN